MKIGTCFFLLLSTVATLGNAASSHAAAPPNIVVFLVDDMGWQDTSVPFHTHRTALNDRYYTPHMEELARGGMKFTQAYACSVCSPSRISLMTGLNAARHRVTNWTLHKDASTDAKDGTLDFPAWNMNGLSASEGTPQTICATPLPDVLRRAGYRTIHAGKAHFGAIGTPGADPKNIGFDVNIAGHAAGGPGSYLGTQNFSAAWRGGGHVWDVPELEKYHGREVFLTEAITHEALAAMDAAVAEKKPFFLYLAHYAVHVPFAQDKRYYQKYRDAGLDDTEAMYAALIEGMDQSLGEVLARLEKHGIANDTVVLFMSDNGGLSAHGRGGKPHTHNRPLASGKGSAYEGGIRVPMIVRWPGVTKPQSHCDVPVIIEDFFPSILEIAGVQNFEQRGGVMDGRSFVSLLRGEELSQAKERAFVWHYPNKWGASGPGIGPSSTIRRGDWKLIYYHTNQSYELFNIVDDLAEANCLADREPARRDELASELGRFLKQTEAQMPTVRRTGTMVPYPGSDRATASSN